MVFPKKSVGKNAKVCYNEIDKFEFVKKHIIKKQERNRCKRPKLFYTG